MILSMISTNIIELLKICTYIYNSINYIFGTKNEGKQLYNLQYNYNNYVAGKYND